MKYALYFTWNNGFQDTLNVERAKEKDINIIERKSKNHEKNNNHI